MSAKSLNIKKDKYTEYEFHQMKKARRKVKSLRQEGFVLVVALLVSCVMLITTVPFLVEMSSHLRSAERSYKSLAALNLAEAGVERAIWELNHGDVSTWEGDDNLRLLTISSFQASGGTVIGDIDIRVIDLDGENPVVESTGIIPYLGNLTIAKSVRVVLEKENVPWDYGIFGNQGVHVNVGATIDSYDSRQGPYGGSNKGEKGHVGTNSTNERAISLTLRSEVYGDAYSGHMSEPDKAIYVSPSSTLQGEKLALSVPKELYPVSPPGLDFKGDFSTGWGEDVTINESGEYTNFILGIGSEVTITSDVTLYITGAFRMQVFSELKIADGASAKIYCGGTYWQGFSTEINNMTKDPSQLLILGTDDFKGTVNVSLDSDFYGAIYAPQANIICMFWGDLYGSLVAKKILVSVASKIHYDEAFEDIKFVRGVESPYTVKSWQEKRSSS